VETDTSGTAQALKSSKVGLLVLAGAALKSSKVGLLVLAGAALKSSKVGLLAPAGAALKPSKVGLLVLAGAALKPSKVCLLVLALVLVLVVPGKVLVGDSVEPQPGLCLALRRKKTLPCTHWATS